MALYRKYRPATFAEVVGQEHVTDPLSTALDTGRISHAYLFSGPRGCGKTSSARILARSLNCVEGPTSRPCGVCSSCVALAPGGSGNLDVIELDAASHGGVDDTRELRDRAFYAPAESRYRVFIVDEAHMVTTAGFNALLKIVEEPPAHLIFIFATTEPEKVLPTIRSRTHHYPFRLLPPATMRGLLGTICDQEQVQVEESVYPLVIRAGGGSPRDSLSVLDQLLAGAGPEGVTYPRALALLGVTDIALIDEAIEALATDDGAALFATVDRVVEAGHDPRRFATDLLERIRDLILLRAVPDAVQRNLVTGPGDVIDRMSAQAHSIGPATLARYAELLHDGLGDMRGATAPRLLLEVICARMLLPSVSEAESAALQRLERLERRVESGVPAAPAPSGAPASASAATAAPPVPSGTPAEEPRRRGAEALAAMREKKSAPHPAQRAQSPTGPQESSSPARTVPEAPANRADDPTSGSAPGPAGVGRGAAPGSADVGSGGTVSSAVSGPSAVVAQQHSASGDDSSPETAAGSPAARAGNESSDQGDIAGRTEVRTDTARSPGPGADAGESATADSMAGPSGAAETAATSGAGGDGRPEEAGATTSDARPDATGSGAPQENLRAEPEVRSDTAGHAAAAPEHSLADAGQIDADREARISGAVSGDSANPVPTRAADLGSSGATAAGGSEEGLHVESAARPEELDGGTPASTAGVADSPGPHDGANPDSDGRSGAADQAVPDAAESAPAVHGASDTATSAPGVVDHDPAGTEQRVAAAGLSPDPSSASAQEVAGTDARAAGTEARALEPEQAAPSAAGSGADVLREVDAAWADIRAKARESSAALPALLSGAAGAVRVEDDTIVFAHPHAPLAQRLSTPQNIDAVRAAVHAVIGRQYGVRWEVGSGGSADTGGAADRSARGGAEQSAARGVRGDNSGQSQPPRFVRPSQSQPQSAGGDARGGQADAKGAAGDRRDGPGQGQRREFHSPRGGATADRTAPDDDIPPPDAPDFPDDPGSSDYSPVGYDGVPPALTPEEEQEMLAESAQPVPPDQRRDPDEVALELLSSELGATRMGG
ncbi:DNA polymerase III subunit gamma and tau [Nocardia sp. NPDC052254]|uniref:DNA polymerase III subunit gamma and tau n=1 Tax=Nocardia sp. NPDC052254 TaxID=3155681 RepID=UPI003440BCC7